MDNKQMVFAGLGTAIGFILGFFVAQIAVLPDSPSVQARAGAAESGSRPPADHPSDQLMQMMQALRQEAQANPTDFQSRAALGRAYLEMRLFTQAVPWLEEANALKPTDTLILNELASAYYYSGEPQKAITFFNKSLETSPDEPQVMQNLGVVHAEMENYAEAVRLWKRLLKLHPDYVHAETVQQQIERAQAQM